MSMMLSNTLFVKFSYPECSLQKIWCTQSWLCQWETKCLKPTLLANQHIDSGQWKEGVSFDWLFSSNISNLLPESWSVPGGGYRANVFLAWSSSPTHRSGKLHLVLFAFPLFPCTSVSPEFQQHQPEPGIV